MLTCVILLSALWNLIMTHCYSEVRIIKPQPMMQVISIYKVILTLSLLAATFVLCSQPWETFWTQIRTDKMSVLMIWIQIVWHPDSVLERIFMPPKELWEAYSNRTVRPSVCVSVPLSCPGHIFYILWGRNSKFGVLMHLGMSRSILGSLWPWPWPLT